ncbi:MAG: alpha/beta fold hydrolase [Bacillota bacterium]
MSMEDLILLPGWGMEMPAWSSILKGLADVFRLHFVEWNGMRSTGCFRERVMRLADGRGMQSFSILGWSLGSLVALDIACSYPLRVNQLILLGGTSRFTVDESGEYRAGWPREIVERLKVRLARDSERTLQSFYRSMFSPGELEKGDLERFLKSAVQRFRGVEEGSLLAGLDYLVEADYRGRMEEIQSPALFIHGEEDLVCPPAASRYMAGRIRAKAGLRLIPGCGHLPHFTRANRCLKWIKEFTGVGKID